MSFERMLRDEIESRLSRVGSNGSWSIEETVDAIMQELAENLAQVAIEDFHGRRGLGKLLREDE